MQDSEKKALRRRVRASYGGDAARHAESGAICGHLLAWTAYRQAKTVAAYLPLPREADVTQILTDVLASGRRLVLPKIAAAPCMTMRRVDALSQLVPGPMGLMEPAESAPVVAPADIDLMLVPLEAIDRRGVRLGKGGGYYDRMLAEFAGVAVGVALSWQWVDSVPREAWDRPLTAVVDAAGVHDFTAEDPEQG